MDAKEEAKELHAKLTSDLNEQFGLFEADRYEQLVNRLKAKLSPKVRKEAKHIMDILEALERNGTFGPGNYQYLKNVINEYDGRVVADLIEPTEREIQRILSRGQGTGSASGRRTASGSTYYNNQATRVEMDAKEEAKELHAKLTSDLNEQFGLFEADRYEQLVNRLKAKLSPKVRKEAKHIMDILEALERNGTFGPGNYQYLKNVINEYDGRVVADLIEPTEREIQRILSRGQGTGSASGRRTASGSTYYNNQATRVEMDAKEEAKELHAKLTSDLNEQFGLFEADRYEQLVNRLKAKLSPKVRKEAKHIMDILEALERNGTFGPGNYQYLKNVINEYDGRVVADLIEPTERKIQRILSRGQGTGSASGRRTASGSTYYNNQASTLTSLNVGKRKNEDEELVSTEPRDSSPPAEHVSQNNSSEYNYVQPSQSCEIKSGLNPNIKSSSEVQTTSSKVYVRVKARKRDISNIHDESTAAASLTGFTKEEINFTKMGMIALNILADVLYDLLKPDKPYLRPRCGCDISYLYSEHRKLNKHVPSNSNHRQYPHGPWGGKWPDIQNTDIAIGDDIERIRLTRNELQHSDIFQINDTRFNELCHILSELLKRFDHYNKPTRLYTDQLNEILAKTVSAEEVKSIENEISGMAIEVEIEHQINVPTQ
ncbi:uncharacterized protein LOC134681346 [Mytilus trossulus]|uniref:uncharacterized protein LOC134681346 n=1 Tax=Mytilus trossulus TaxID=6551 RepID=UPI003005EEF4